jgi:hypothetical protein
MQYIQSHLHLVTPTFSTSNHNSILQLPHSVHPVTVASCNSHIQYIQAVTVASCNSHIQYIQAVTVASCNSHIQYIQSQLHLVTPTFSTSKQSPALPLARPTLPMTSQTGLCYVTWNPDLSAVHNDVTLAQQSGLLNSWKTRQLFMNRVQRLLIIAVVKPWNSSKMAGLDCTLNGS